MLLIGNGRLLTLDEQERWFEDGAVVCEGEKIIGLGEFARLKEAYPQAEFIDAQGGLIMPGFINTHHHIYSALARGMAIANYDPQGFMDILSGLWWKLDQQLTLKDIRISARLTAVDCIKNGVTTVFDHHAGYGDISGSLNTIAGELLSAGLRCCLCYEISDRHGPEQAAAAIAENAEFIRYAAAEGNDRLSALCGMHASFTLSDRTLDEARAALPRDMGFHIHVAEGVDDLKHCQGHYQSRVVERLHQRGLLGPRSIAVHCVHVDGREIDLLALTDTAVAHNPQSNMNNAVGCPPLAEMMAKGVLCGLGTDGYTNDMLESYKAVPLLHRLASGDCRAAGAEAAALLFRNNALIANRHFPIPLGMLKAGAAADIIICDYHPITPMDAANAYSHLLFGANGRSVVTTIAAGRILMRDRIIAHVDEERIAAQGREQAAALWQRINA